MREIKFRAWDGKKMQYNVQPNLTYKEPHCMVEDQFIIYEPKGRKGFWYDVKVDDIMQFTGLQDKNGVDIYESDIVGVRLIDKVEPLGYFICNCQVKIYKGCWCLFQIGFDYSNSPFDEISILHIEDNELEVIGNIHENPEFLT